MHVLGFITTLLLISTTFAVDTFNTMKADGLVINPLTSTVIIAFPPCTYDGKTAELIVKNSSSTLTETFIVPQCRLRRDIIIPSDSISGNQLSRNVGYRIRNLWPEGNYTAEYNIKDSTNNLVATGAAVQFVLLNQNQAVPDKMARSGGMVVITVLLSIAMFLLLIGLVITLVLGGRK